MAKWPYNTVAWQRLRIIRAIYGSRRDRKRLVRTALITMPRKNGKTQLVAALSLAHLIGPESEERGQVYSAVGRGDLGQADRDGLLVDGAWRRSERDIRGTPVERYLDVIERVVGGYLRAALGKECIKNVKSGTRQMKSLTGWRHSRWADTPDELDLGAPETRIDDPET